MSDSTLGRALEFMSKPKDVEVNRDGYWVHGSMVGWRQEEGGSCRVMVRVTERGMEKTAWADLADVRLPEHRSFPRTESLPLLPRLPAPRTEQETLSGTSAAWGARQDPRDLAEPLTWRAPRADTTGWTAPVSEPAADVGLETGRHREPAGSGHRGEAAGHGVRSSWWPSSGELASSQVEVEPTRLMTLPAPHHWQTGASRHGNFAAY